MKEPSACVYHHSANDLVFLDLDLLLILVISRRRVEWLYPIRGGLLQLSNDTSKEEEYWIPLATIRV